MSTNPPASILGSVENLVQAHLAQSGQTGARPNVPPPIAPLVALPGAGSPLVRGPMPTVWYSDGIAGGWQLADDIIIAAQPPAVQLHTWDPQHVAPLVRAAIPNVMLVVGVGIDGIARHVAKGDWSVAKGVEVMVSLARRAHDIGAVAIKWNAEAGWKTAPNSVQRARIRDLIRTALRKVRDLFPDLRQWHTAYDHPTFHSTYPWDIWLGEDSPIEASFAQVYAAAEGNVMAHVGALPRREAASLDSWSVAIRKGWIRADVPEGAPGDDLDVDFRPYYQVHHVTAVDTVAGAMLHPVVALWALPTRADAAGREAFVVMCAIWRAGLWGDVRALQRAVGVSDDGKFGPLTHRAVVAWAARQ